ncbi:nitrilase-related carbon-nitrogen hydrolase [Roseateles sp.]|uniref:nitrilase-related carbon-nitrogen hydrolase n=1 Tax=Roseateles sp. TaxID=1971397 RepID=UPI003267606A
MAVAYLAGPSLATALLLLLGASVAAWNFQRLAGRRRWASFALTLIVWQAGGMGWITAVLAPELAGPDRLAATALLFLLLWTLSLGSLLVLTWGAHRLLAGRSTQALALPLAWWVWMAARDFCWWGGGYGSLSLPLLTLPGLSTWLPLLGPALFEALLWALLLAFTLPHAAAPRRLAGAAALALALVCPSPWSWTAPAGEGLSIAIVSTPPLPAGPFDWTLQARDEALAAIHRAIRRAPAGSVVITPEVFLPEPPPPTAEGVWGDLLAALEARQQRLLLGTALPHPDAASTQALMNVALLLTPQPGGEMAAGIYAKQRLAPVGEQLPWPGLLTPLSDRWLNHTRRVARRAGPPELGEPLVTEGATLGVLLCHEVAFADQRASTAESLLHLASDHWSSDPRSARQALGLARLRAMESGKWLLSITEGRAAQLVDPQGHTSHAREVELLPTRQGLTPFVRWRGLQPVAPVALLAALLLGGRRQPTAHVPFLVGAKP